MSLYNELIALNEEFILKVSPLADKVTKKQQLETNKRLEYITELAYSRITGNTEAYNLMIFDLRNDEGLISKRLAQLTTKDEFSAALGDYLCRVEKKF